MYRILRCFTLLLLGLGIAIPSQAAEEDTILILDASGSMWGQIDGINKIVIAKDVVEGLVRSLPDQRRLGFVAYGHRRKGDCKDIQTLAKVGAPRGDVIKELQALSPKGKTPLSKSIEHAADALNFKKNAATVILVSDGLENCDVDPCALSKTLEEQGLDFKVHVIGFDVTPQEREGLQCIAEETGGQFLSADTADGLTDALSQVAVVDGDDIEPGDTTPATSELFLKATILNEGPQIQSDLSWVVRPAVGGDPIITSDKAYLETQVPPGDYIAEATWTGWRKGKPGGGAPKTGTMAFAVKPQQPKVVTLPVDLALPITLQAPDSTPEGVGFDVTWSGPDGLGAFVHVSGLDDGPRDPIYFFATQKARDAFEKANKGETLDSDGDGDFDADDLATAPLGAPSRAGEYEIRYILGDPRLILARKRITVTDSIYTLSIPETVAATSTFDIEWSGPRTDGDFITLIEAGSKKVFQNGVTVKLSDGKPVQLTAPAKPGKYEVRYILANGYTLYADTQHVVQASRQITVTDVSAELSAPQSAVGGSTISVNWTGPEDERGDDSISVVAVGATKRNRDSTAQLHARGKALNPAEIRVPAIPGNYELVYILEPGRRIITRNPLTITKPQAQVSAPKSVKVGSAFEVTYQGDAFKGDRVVLVPADYPDGKMWSKGLRYGFGAKASETSGTIAERLVKTPGAYELRYVTGMQHQVLARQAITITP